MPAKAVKKLAWYLTSQRDYSGVSCLSLHQNTWKDSADLLLCVARRLRGYEPLEISDRFPADPIEVQLQHL